MREILFKAKRLDNGEWVEGPLYCADEHTVFILETPVNIGQNSNGTWWIDDGMYQYDPETVCQFTGLTDKNGMKIFDGDIVNIREHTSDVNGWYKVIYDTINHCWALERDPEYHHHYFSFSELNGFAEDSEVIGNIFDNPELVAVPYE